MQKTITTILFCFILTQTFGQIQKKLTTYLLAEYNKTLYDRTIGNNPWGIGLGLQAFFNNKTKFKPTIELTGSVYLEDDKVLRLNADGSIPGKDNSVRGMINLLAGSSYHPVPTVYLSFIAGPSFISGQTLLAIKPSFGFYFSKSLKWMGKISYLNVFNRFQTTKEDFGSLSFSIGHKLF